MSLIVVGVVVYLRRCRLLFVVRSLLFGPVVFFWSIVVIRYSLVVVRCLLFVMFFFSWFVV